MATFAKKDAEGKKVPGSFEHTFNTLGCFTYKSNFSGDLGVGAICVVEE
jgi:plastocyanin